MITVVIYTPAAHRGTWLAQCAAKLADLDLALHSTTDDYATAADIVEHGEADAILVARHDHVPHGPRVIVAAEVDDSPHGIDTVPLRAPRQRRPRPLDG